jgi:hypothetical protein
MQKGLKIFSAVLFVLILIVGVVFFSDTSSGKMVSVILYFSYILMGLCAILAIVLPLPLLMQYPKKLKKAGFTIILVAVVFVVGYLLSSGAPMNINVETQPSEQVLKLTDTGLIITYIMLAASILAICGGAVKNIIDKKQ